MKISRQYLLGLGSGLILSALIALLFNPISPTPQQSSSIENSSKESSLEENSSAEDSSKLVSLSPQETSTAAPEKSAQAKKTFVIPAGASADKIAQLLQAEGWIQNKEDFLTLVKAQKLEKRFVAGTYELTDGLSIENIINRLIP